MYMGSSRSHPPHIHMLSNLAYPALLTDCGEMNPLNACRCSSAQKDSDILVPEISTQSDRCALIQTHALPLGLSSIKSEKRSADHDHE